MAEWRLVCKQRMEEQAIAEARTEWKLKPKRSLPFNPRLEHVQQVVQLALRLTQETGADVEIVEAAAWLHDICKSSPGHGAAGAVEATRILSDTDFPPEKIPAVADVIRKHVGLYRQVNAPPLQPLEAAVLWDADKLSKLGEQALVAQLSTRRMFGMTLSERHRYLDEFVRSVLPRTVASMNTLAGRRLADVRYRNMVETLDAWKREEEGREL